MRLATLSDHPSDRTTTVAAVEISGAWVALPYSDLSELLSDYQGDLKDLPQIAGTPVGSTFAPIQPLPHPSKIICCGLNYGEHIRETGRDLPSHPTLFAKFADTLTGPTADLTLAAGVEWDWEAELAVVVGATISGASVEDAHAAIAGYTVANDLSARDWQRRTLQWLQGKAWDRTTPLGPVIVTADECDPSAGLEVVCRVNGEEVQRDSTSTLVFDCAQLLAYISTFTTLRPGDLVLTGTPGGVGMALDPPRYLADGDLLETEIVGIGALRNTISIPAI